MNAELDRLYGLRTDDPDFAEVLRECRPTGSEDSLAELIEADGRWRLRRGRAVDLERYLAAVPNLTHRADALDAALEVALRAEAGSSRVSESAIVALSTRYPQLAESIREAAALNAALWSTTGLRNRVAPRPVKVMPCEFGPPSTDGRRRYVLRELIGQGSFGQVYRAEDRQLSEKDHVAEVAIKILSAIERTDHDRHRMIDEATKARRISHPNVVQVLDRGVMDDDEDFIVYEYVGGGDLGDVAATSLPMPPRKAASLMAQIARGVHAAHAAGVIHCDLKPSNVMLTEDGQPKVADFGIAVRLGEERRAALAGEEHARGPIGNIAFISPEQYRGDDSGFSVPSDVYALGGILYYLLTGLLPNGASREEIAATHDSGDIRNTHRAPKDVKPEIDHDLDSICARALHAQAASRQESAAALADDLERWLCREPITWQQPSLAHRFMLWTRRKPGLAAITAAMILVVIAGATIASHFAREADQRAMDARIAQMQVEAEKKEKAMRRQLGAVVTAGVVDIQKDERFVTDMLMQAWVFEYLFGPKVLGDLTMARQLWSNRVEAVRQVLEQRRQRGLGESIESLMWESALAFWIVSDRDYARALPLLDQNIEQWRRVAQPSDPWVAELEILRQCALASRACDANAGWLDSADRVDALGSAANTLEAAAAGLAVAHPRSPMHFLVLNRLIDLYDASGLNNVVRAAELRASVRELLDNSQLQATGVAKAVKDTEKAIRQQSSSQPVRQSEP